MKETNKIKSTGIVRRVDELGRVVVPKEIRNSLRIFVGTQLEILRNENDEIILKKSSKIKSILDIANLCAKSLSKPETLVLISDMEQILCADGENKKNFINKILDTEFLNFILKNNYKKLTKDNFICLNKDLDLSQYSYQNIFTIKVNGDESGAIIIYTKKDIETEYAETVKKFIQLYLEE